VNGWRSLPRFPAEIERDSEGPYNDSVPTSPRKTRRPKARKGKRVPPASVATAVLRGRAAAGQVDYHERMREKILKEAHRLYSVAGYAAVSMREVAKGVGFSAQAIYYYYPSKEAMFAALADEGLRLLELQHPSEELADPIENLRLLYVRYYDFSKAHPEYFTLLWMDPAAAVTQQEPQIARIARMGADTARRIQRCKDEGIFPSTVDVARVATTLFNAVHGPAVMGLTGRPDAGAHLDAVASDLLDSVIFAVRSGTVCTSAVEAPPKTAHLLVPRRIVALS
jgi:AcrR family transcriptional regulator